MIHTVQVNEPTQEPDPALTITRDGIIAISDYRPYGTSTEAKRKRKRKRITEGGI